MQSPKQVLILETVRESPPVMGQSDVYNRMRSFAASYVNDDTKSAIVQFKGRIASIKISLDQFRGMSMTVSEPVLKNSTKNALQNSQLSKIQNSKHHQTQAQTQSVRPTSTRPPIKVLWNRTGGTNDIPPFQITATGNCDKDLIALVLEILRVFVGRGRATASLEDRSWTPCFELNPSTGAAGAVSACRYRLLSRGGERFYHDLGFRTIREIIDPETSKRCLTAIRGAHPERLAERLEARAAMLGDSRDPVTFLNPSGKPMVVQSSKDISDTLNRNAKLATDLRWAIKLSTLMGPQQGGLSPTLAGIIENAVRADCVRGGAMLWQLVPSVPDRIVEKIGDRMAPALLPEELALRYAIDLCSVMYCDL